MPVTQLQDQGGLGTLLGLAGGFLLGNPERKRKQAEREYQHTRDTAEDARRASADTRADTQARTYADNITSEIATRNAATTRTAANDAHATLQQGLFAKYMPMLQTPPKGQDVKQWATSIRNQAIKDGLTDPTKLSELNTEIARVIRAAAPTPQQVMQGLPQLKAGATPQEVSRHYLDAASRALQNPDLPEDQRKLLAEQYHKMAMDAVSHQPKAETAEEKYAREHGVRMPSYADLHPRPDRVIIDRGNLPQSTRASAVENRALEAKDLKAALKIVEAAGLGARDRSQVRQSVMDQFRPDKPVHEEGDNTTFAAQVMGTTAVNNLPLADKNDLNTNLRKYGYKPVVSHLRDLATGKSTDKDTPPDRARRVLQALGEKP